MFVTYELFYSAAFCWRNKLTTLLTRANDVASPFREIFGKRTSQSSVSIRRHEYVFGFTPIDVWRSVGEGDEVVSVGGNMGHVEGKSMGPPFSLLECLRTRTH